MGSPRERMLRLLSLLQSGRRWPAFDLAKAAETTPRTLRRDIEFLRTLGYPVRSARGPGGHYQLVAGRTLPPLMLDDDEAIAVVLGLRLAAASGTGLADSTGPAMSTEAAERAETKLRAVLPTRLRTTTDELLAATDISTTSHRLPDPAVMQTITRAIARDETLRFGYANARGASERHVEPARLVRLERHWYLLAWDRTKSDWRTFRLDRIVDRPVPATRFTPRRLPAENPVDFLREHFQGLPEHTVVLTLHASPAEAATKLYSIDGSIEPLTDHSCRYTAHVDSYAWLTVVLALTDVEFTIDAPEEFRRHLSAVSRRFTHALDTALSRS